jgi:hypothetical protein
MLRLKKIRLVLILISIFILQNSSGSSVEFRTPAKMYAGGYSVKLRLSKNLTEYDIPVWVKPDQKESSLDPVLMRDLGYQDRDYVFDSVILSGKELGKRKFKKMQSEWAFVPDFSKSCCHGVIGQDLLSQFEVRFDPENPVHLMWKSIPDVETGLKVSKEFQASLKQLFSLKNTIDVPFVLNLKNQKITFEKVQPKHLKEIFTFSFLPPSRHLKVLEIDQKLTEHAKAAGFRSGMIITELNHQSVSGLDRWEIEKFLSGEKTALISLRSNQGQEFKYDFQKGKFE